MAYSRPEPLTRDHDRGGFDCGDPALNGWLTDHALSAQSSGSARVFATTDGARLVGYYALAASLVGPEEATGRAIKGEPRRRPIAAVLLARLAVDLQHQRKGLGSSLLQDAMVRVDQAADSIGGRVLLVHAKDDRLRAWYERFGFEQSPTDRLHLMLLMKDLRAFLAAAAG